MFQQRFSYLISKELAQEITQEEFAELQQMLAENTLLKEKYAAFKKLHRQQQTDRQPDVELALQKVWGQIKQQQVQSNDTVIKSSRRLIGGLAAAAMFLMALAAVYIFKKNNQTPAGNAAATFSVNLSNEGWQEKQNSKGIRSYITLSDGSKVWLNADSKLDYPKAFENKTREVYLSGEAFFEVSKNPERPFIIHLDEGTVRVLGTSFNIKAYKGSKVVETSVATGRVAFIPKKISASKHIDTTFLTRNLKAVYSIQTQEVKTYATISTEDKAWVDGTLIFKALSFGDIAAQLERAFGKKIVFADDEVKNYTLTGSFENNSLDEILYYFSLTKPFAYTISDKEIVISKPVNH